MPSGLLLLFSVVVLGGAAGGPLVGGLGSLCFGGVQTSLPIWHIHSRIVEAVTHNNCVVLIAPTGSGKTTQVPQMLLDDPVRLGTPAPGRGRIVVLQPRRVAARAVAARVAWERRCPLGSEVGYQIRFDDRTSLGTRICYVTEGILLRWLQDDPGLSDIAVVIFDEFHERNLLSDVALALARQLQQSRRPDLKILVMSATLDAAPVADYLGGCPVLEVRRPGVSRSKSATSICRTNAPFPSRRATRWRA